MPETKFPSWSITSWHTKQWCVILEIKPCYLSSLRWTLTLSQYRWGRRWQPIFRPKSSTEPCSWVLSENFQLEKNLRNENDGVKMWSFIPYWKFYFTIFIPDKDRIWCLNSSKNEKGQLYLNWCTRVLWPHYLQSHHYEGLNFRGLRNLKESHFTSDLLLIAHNVQVSRLLI